VGIRTKVNSIHWCVLSLLCGARRSFYLKYCFGFWPFCVKKGVQALFAKMHELALSSSMHWSVLSPGSQDLRLQFGDVFTNTYAWRCHLIMVCEFFCFFKQNVSAKRQLTSFDSKIERSSCHSNTRYSSISDLSATLARHAMIWLDLGFGWVVGTRERVMLPFPMQRFKVWRQMSDVRLASINKAELNNRVQCMKKQLLDLDSSTFVDIYICTDI
jgi:hypothetical protein